MMISLCNRRRRQIINHGIISISLILLHFFPSVGAQQQPSPPPPPVGGQFPYQFNPSVAAIIVVLIAALFFMGFFSVYIRQCYEITPNGTGNIVRRAGGASLRRRTARGLDQTVIENLPTFPYSEVKELKIGKGALECAVCLNEFDDEEILRLLPKCDHVFHPECIDAWLQSHVTCPVCRSNLAAETNDENPESIQVPAPAPAPAVAVRENPVTEEVVIQIEEERIEENDRNRRLEVVDRTRSFNQIRPPPVSKSVRGWPFWSKFPRSHSTGHSLVQPGENTDRFTLRLPEEIRKEVMTRALNRTRSVLLPSEGSTRRGYRSNWVSQEGNSRGIRDDGRFSGRGKSDRWIFTKAPPFLSRGLSVRSPRVAADGEGSTSSRTPRSGGGGGSVSVKLPSFKCLEPNAKDDETGLVSADSIKSPAREGGFHQS